jgi:hypothetical protein
MEEKENETKSKNWCDNRFDYRGAVGYQRSWYTTDGTIIGQ